MASITNRACQARTWERQACPPISPLFRQAASPTRTSCRLRSDPLIIEGKVRHEFGPGLKQEIENQAGDFIYIKPGVPHEVFNMSDTEPVVAFVARSSADEWDKIIPYDRTQNR
jgi:uncharacterized RmlC-like cupin family protein